MKLNFLLALCLAWSVFSCRFIVPDGGTAEVSVFSADTTILAPGEITRIRCQVASRSGETSSDSIEFATNKGYFVDISDTAMLGGKISTALDSGGASDIYLINPFTVEEETCWIEASYKEQSRRIFVIFIPGRQTANNPCAIHLSNVDYQAIGILGAGFQEVAKITFTVTGSFGLPVGDGIWVDFSKSGPGGNPAETLTVSSSATSAGRAAAVLRSGTKSGTVLITATVRGTDVTSSAVPVVIHGGRPHNGYQAVVSDAKNIPGGAVAGAEANITGYYYDICHNPVVLGTGVYFTSNTGGITAASFTDADGIATAVFTSGSSVPEDAFARIRVQTTSDSGKTMVDSCLILLSGSTQIGIFNSDSTSLTDTITISNGGSKDLLIIVSDAKGNPISAGSTVQITVSSGQVTGQTSVTMEDTIDRNKTKFNVKWSDDSETQTLKRSAYLSVKVTSRNGDAQAGAWATLY